MLRQGRAATSAVLVGMLVFQAACVRPMGPPAPLRPEDPIQPCVIEDAHRVQVWTVDGREYRLSNASLEGQRLTGKWREGRPRDVRDGRVKIPVDSVADVQLLRRRGLGSGWFLLGAAAGVGGLLIALAASLSGGLGGLGS